MNAHQHFTVDKSLTFLQVSSVLSTEKNYPLVYNENSLRH